MSYKALRRLKSEISVINARMGTMTLVIGPVFIRDTKGVGLNAII